MPKLEKMERSRSVSRVLKASQLKEHQREMSELMVENSKAYIIADMGSGKTAATLDALDTLRILEGPTKILVIAPLNVAKFSWPDELDSWEYDFKYVNLAGVSAQKREELLLSPHELCIINRENTQWLKKMMEEHNLSYGILVYDEISRLKGGRIYTARRVRKDGSVVPRGLSEFGSLLRISSSFERVIGLTGTPTQEGVIDLWGQMKLLDNGSRLGVRKKHFLDRWFAKDPFGFKHVPRPHAEKKIINRVKDIAFCMYNVFDLPPLTVHNVWVTLSKREMIKYQEMKKEFVFQAKNGKVVEAVNGGVLMGKLLQLANGSIYVEDGEDRDIEEFHDHKITALKKIADAEGNLLVFYSYQFDKDKLRDHFPEAKFFDDLDNPVKEWNSGEIKMLCVHPAACSHGLNLQLGGNVMVWYGLNWSLELYQQANKRLHRPGQTNPVRIYRILAKGTADEKVAPTLREKAIRQTSIMEALTKWRTKKKV